MIAGHRYQELHDGKSMFFEELLQFATSSPGEVDDGEVPSLTQKIEHMELKKWVDQQYSSRLLSAYEVIPQFDDFSPERVPCKGLDPITSYFVKN